jgi:hypothetical protein
LLASGKRCTLRGRWIASSCHFCGMSFPLGASALNTKRREVVYWCGEVCGEVRECNKIGSRCRQEYRRPRNLVNGYIGNTRSSGDGVAKDTMVVYMNQEPECLHAAEQRSREERLSSTKAMKPKPVTLSTQSTHHTQRQSQIAKKFFQFRHGHISM